MTKIIAQVIVAFTILSNSIFADIQPENLYSRVFTELGQVVSGTQGGNQELSKEFFHRLGAEISGTKAIDERLFLNVGVGGVLWQPFPVVRTQFYRNNLRTSLSILETSAKFKITESLSLKGGFLNFKYNSYATNLGEYLFRGEAYPSILRTDNWSIVNDANYHAPGVMLEWNLLEGKVRQEFILQMEWRGIPVGDISPAYLLTLQPLKGLEIGGGISLHRWLPLPQNESTPNEPINTYATINNFPEVQNAGQVEITTSSGIDTVFAFWRGGSPQPDVSEVAGALTVNGVVKLDQEGSPAGVKTGILSELENLRNCSQAVNRIGQCAQRYIDADNIALISQVDSSTGIVIPDSTVPVDGTMHRFTFKATKFTGFFALDFGKMFDLEIGPFALFGEVGVLGVEDQPFYYEDIKHRMPMTLGMHIPTFGLLDLLTFQVEKFDNPNSQSETRVQEYQSPIPFVDASNPFVTDDDIKWSILLNKNLIKGFGIKAKLASDYLRLRNDDFEQLLNTETLLNKPSEWYYMTQLYWGF